MLAPHGAGASSLPQAAGYGFPKQCVHAYSSHGSLCCTLVACVLLQRPQAGLTRLGRCAAGQVPGHVRAWGQPVLLGRLLRWLSTWQAC